MWFLLKIYEKCEQKSESEDNVQKTLKHSNFFETATYFF